MRIGIVEQKSEEKCRSSLRDLSKFAHTYGFQRKVNHSLHVLEDFLTQTKNPVISCGGGKDGTAIALLANLLGAKVPFITADPPNPLPDREKHNAELKRWLGGKWYTVPYDWDVNAVLDGTAPYPEGLKMKRLSDFQKENNIDGVVFGIRAAESRGRAINLVVKGEIYQVRDGLRCQPIARWSAEDSLCLTLLMDAPINPVYTKMDGCGGLEQLHDGTWWPHGMEDRSGWIKKYYPDYFELYEKALRVEGCKDSACRY